jgi:hypothetical protein
MDMNALLRLFAVCSLLCLQTPSTAQPCGITAGINLAAGTATVLYSADSSNYQPGWIGYRYEWIVNDESPVTGPFGAASYSNWLPAGYNRLCLRVYGTNPLTGDSCIDEYCNIFQSTGDAIYPEFDVTVIGQDVTVTGSYRGGYPTSPSLVQYDFGDGTQSTGNSLTASHTYTGTGDKNIYLYVQIYNPLTGGLALGQTGRIVNIGNGVGNIEINNINSFPIGCDSTNITVNSSPAFTFGSVYTNLAGDFNNILDGVSFPAPIPPVAGHDFIGISAISSATGNSDDYSCVLVSNSNCFDPDTVTGSVFNDLNANGIRDAGETGMAGVKISIRKGCAAAFLASESAEYSTLSDSAGNYSLLIPNASVRVEATIGSAYTLTFPQYNYYNTPATDTITAYTNYNFGLSLLSTHICGRTYLDDNNDSVFNSGDRVLPGVLLVARNTITGFEYREFSSVNGQYCFDLPPGDFVIKAANVPVDSALVSPDSISVNASGGGTFNNRNFGFRSPVPTDFNLTLSSSLEARPGFNYAVACKLRNTGYDKGKGELVFSYDTSLTLLNISPTNGVINTTAHTITWTTDSVNPGLLLQYTANFNIPVSTPLGTVLSHSAVITALTGTIENDVSDNAASLTQVVIGSFDPNDKTVWPQGIGATGDVLHNTRLDYRIRFQNTGTASAIHVFVVDTIDEDLDLNTLVIHRASHTYDLVMSGNIITWRFFNINLPDSNTNEPLSHGFIEYSISPKAGLSDGTGIENTAAIYFDFNPPVITNTTLNTMWSSLAAVEEINSPENLQVYPNPGNDRIQLRPQLKMNGRVVIELYNLSGKQVRKLFNGILVNPAIIEADVQDIAQGAYIIVLRHNGGTERVKWLKQ